MKKINHKATRTLGIRFLLFRKAIKKTKSQMAEELEISVPKIADIEKGAADPGIHHLHYLHQKYGLNINWILCKKGDMFVKDRPPDLDLDTDYVMRPPVQLGDSRYEIYDEFFQLMQIPAVGKAIMDRLKEIKDLLRKEE